MSEYEWETRRVPRTTRPEMWGANRPRAREVAEFLALEHPRESVAWVLRQHSESKPKAVLPLSSPAPKPRIPSSVPPLDVSERA